MTWFKVDDGFHSHAKAMTAGTAALGLWVRCGSWSAYHLTDGFVPANVAREYGTGTQIKALVTAGLWLAVDRGYQFNDFTDYNPTSEQVKADRGAAKERQRKAREAAKQKRDSERTSKEVTPLSRRDKPVTHAPVTDVSQSPRPDPTRPEGSNEPLIPEPTVLPATLDASLTVNQRSKRLTDAYAALEPMCKWPAVNGIVKKAIEAARWSDQDIYDALNRLAKESRSVTVDSLRTELNGFTPQRTNGGNIDGFRALIQKFEDQRIGGIQ
jgi:hypothetical protein